MNDGRSSVEYSTPSKYEVAVAVIVGHEPLKIFDDRQKLDVESAILFLAERIKAARRESRKSKPKRKK